ncbi:hypothetical protein GCM10010206_66080 [Streptomyces cinerochromogenes]|nr:hypothetical protein GCM10010206_66080 [Streptomyces cinerochromogenes]
MRLRSATVVAAQPTWAARARAKASSTSPGVETGRSASGAPVYGEVAAAGELARACGRHFTVAAGWRGTRR